MFVRGCRASRFARWLPATVAFVAVATALGCDEQTTTTLIVQNESTHPVTVSLGLSAWRKTVDAGDAATLYPPVPVKQLWIDGGTADSSLTLAFTQSIDQPLVVVVTRGDLRAADPAPFKAKFFEFWGKIAGVHTLETAAAGGLPTAWVATLTVDRHPLTVANDTPRVIRVETAGARGLITSADFEPGQHSRVPYIILFGERIQRIDVSDPGADRGYRIYFTRAVDQALDLALPADPLPTPTQVPVDPRLCTLTPLGCSKTSKASPTADGG